MNLKQLFSQKPSKNLTHRTSKIKSSTQADGKQHRWTPMTSRSLPREFSQQTQPRSPISKTAKILTASYATWIKKLLKRFCIQKSDLWKKGGNTNQWETTSILQFRTVTSRSSCRSLSFSQIGLMRTRLCKTSKGQWIQGPRLEHFSRSLS